MAAWVYKTACHCGPGSPASDNSNVAALHQASISGRSLPASQMW